MKSYNNYYIAPHAHAAFGRTNHVLMSQQKAMKPRTKTRQSKKVALVRYLSLLASASYVIPFLIVSRWRIILGVFVEIEPSR